MSLNGSMAPNSSSWVDADGSPQQQSQPPQQYRQPPSQQLQRPQPHQHHPPSAPSAPPPPPASSHEDQLDRQMLRHLMRKYTEEGLKRLMQEETTSTLSPNDAASVLTSSTYSSVKSDDSPSLFDSGSSIRTASDASSARQSIISNVSARTAKFLGRKSSSSSTSTTTTTKASSSTTDQHRDASATPQWDADNVSILTTSSEPGPTTTTSAAKQKGTFMCGFCKEEAIQKTCTRKNDLKRHIEDFHNMDAQWFCHQRGCGMVFDWQTAYKTHLKHAHGGSRMSLDDAKVTLCPQTVFACGFENCIQVFEAPSDADASTTFKEYVAHVVKHLDEGSNSGEWTYSTRIRNLMRQSGALRAWTTSSWPEAERNRLTWQPQTSGILRKRLETRHLGDLNMLVQYAIALGSEPESIKDFHESFCIPVRDQCRAQIPGHKTRMQPHPPPPGQPQPHHQNPPAAAVPEQSDPFQFRISRGTGTHPNLANYYASQRRMFVARPPVRSGRSARPPVRSMTQGYQQPQQQSHSSPAVFDPTGFYGQQQQPQQPQQYAIMSGSDGGIIADDLRSLRSMASGSSGGGGDVDMADAQMMDAAGYLPQEFSGAPYAQGMQSPGDACIKMEGQPQFAGYNAQNGY